MRFRMKVSDKVEAQQWYPPGDQRHVPIEGIEHRPPTVMYSIDGKYFYVTGAASLSTQWLSVEKVPIEKAESFKGNGFDGMCGFKHGEERYGRHSLPFAMYSVKSGKSEPVDQNSDLYLDYGSAEGWKEHPVGYASIATASGKATVHPGDWIVTWNDGKCEVLNAAMFAERFERDE